MTTIEFITERDASFGAKDRMPVSEPKTGSVGGVDMNVKSHGFQLSGQVIC